MSRECRSNRLLARRLLEEKHVRQFDYHSEEELARNFTGLLPGRRRLRGVEALDLRS